MLKKRPVLPMLLVLLLILSLAGCGSSTDTAQKAASKDAETVAAKAAATDQTDQTPTAPDASGTKGTASSKNGARPGQADGSRLMGQIVSVKDRTVTLALYNMPSGGNPPSAPPSGGTPPTGGQAGGNPPGGQTPALSGENKTITIPDTVKIMSGDRNNAKEIGISDLKAGLMMEVRLNSSTSAVEAVRVMEEGRGGPPARGGAPDQTSSS